MQLPGSAAFDRVVGIDVTDTPVEDLKSLVRQISNPGHSGAGFEHRLCRHFSCRFNLRSAQAKNWPSPQRMALSSRYARPDLNGRATDSKTEPLSFPASSNYYKQLNFLDMIFDAFSDFFQF